MDGGELCGVTPHHCNLASSWAMLAARLLQQQLPTLPNACRHTEVGPHLADRGYNAIDVQGAADFWIRNVTVLNADNAVFLKRTDRATVRGEQLGQAPGPASVPCPRPSCWQFPCTCGGPGPAAVGTKFPLPPSLRSPPPPHPAVCINAAGFTVDVTKPRWAPTAFPDAVNGHPP